MQRPISASGIRFVHHVRSAQISEKGPAGPTRGNEWMRVTSAVNRRIPRRWAGPSIRTTAKIFRKTFNSITNQPNIEIGWKLRPKYNKVCWLRWSVNYLEMSITLRWTFSSKPPPPPPRHLIFFKKKKKKNVPPLNCGRKEWKSIVWATNQGIGNQTRTKPLACKFSWGVPHAAAPSNSSPPVLFPQLVYGLLSALYRSAHFLIVFSGTHRKFQTLRQVSLCV